MCRRTESIDALTAAADCLERTCRVAAIRLRCALRKPGPLPTGMIRSAATVKMLPMSEDLEAIDRLIEDLKRIH